MTIFFNNKIKHFDFIEWFDLNYRFNSIFENLSIKDFLANFLVSFLVDSIMGLYILPI